MLQKEFNFRALTVKDESGRYRPATEDEVIEAALFEINRRFVRGVTLTSASQTMEFFYSHLNN